MALFEPGQPFGSHVLVRRLARGGMGEIWLAERKGISGFSKQVVIKTILEHFMEEAESVEMFLDEGRIAAGLNHPNIAQIFDLGQEDDIYYIAMEYIHGHDLRDLLLAHLDEKKLVPLNLILRIAAQVCEGLFYAHTWKKPDGNPAGIIHRDISPQNILVTFDGTAKLVDFGIARVMTDVTKTASEVLKGKSAYMSPEQVRGEKLDGRSDLFSLSVVLYEMFTGRRLFKRDSEMATFEAVLRSGIPPPSQVGPGVPKPIERLMLKALKRDPKKRFQNARDMQLAIEQAMQETGLLATSAHLSAYMHQVFSEDVEKNQERLKEIKRRMATLPSTKEDAPQLERTSPFSEILTGGKVVGSTTALTSPLKPAVIKTSSPPGGWRLWTLLAVLLGMLATGIWYLLSASPAEGDSDQADAGVDAGAVAGADPGKPDLTDATTLAEDAGTVDEPDPTPPDAGQPPRRADSRRKKGKKKRRKKKTKEPDTPLDIKLER